MTLSMTLGMSIGLRRTFLMMWGELLGLAIVSCAAVAGVATLMVNSPTIFMILRYGGGAYLCFLGVQMWCSTGKMAFSEKQGQRTDFSGRELFLQGFVTAIANPKGWAFMISLLPPFIDPGHALLPQISFLLAIILGIEFCCLIGYAVGGRSLRKILQKKGTIETMNKIAGSLMIGVGLWLATG